MAGVVGMHAVLWVLVVVAVVVVVVGMVNHDLLLLLLLLLPLLLPLRVLATEHALGHCLFLHQKHQQLCPSIIADLKTHNQRVQFSKQTELSSCLQMKVGVLPWHQPHLRQYASKWG